VTASVEKLGKVLKKKGKDIGPARITEEVKGPGKLTKKSSTNSLGDKRKKAAKRIIISGA